MAKHTRDEIAVMFREAEEAYIQVTDLNREEAQKKYFRMLHYVSSRGVDDTRENGGE